MASLFLGGILTELAWEPWVVSELLSKPPSVAAESPWAGNASILLGSQLLRHHLLLPASATLSLPASGAQDSSQHRKPRFASNHICSNKEWRMDEVYKKGNTPADCHRRSFISILELIWWWILHGFPSRNEYINTSNVSSLCSENMTQIFKS